MSIFFHLISSLLLVTSALALTRAAYTDIMTLEVPDYLQVGYFFPILLAKLLYPSIFAGTPSSAVSAGWSALSFSLPFLLPVLLSSHLGGADWKFILSFSFLYGYRSACRMLLTACLLCLFTFSLEYWSAGRQRRRTGRPLKSGTRNGPHKPHHLPDPADQAKPIKGTQAYRTDDHLPFFPYLAASALPDLLVPLTRILSGLLENPQAF